jgi:hypothetical protein
MAPLEVIGPRSVVVVSDPVIIKRILTSQPEPRGSDIVAVDRCCNRQED